MLRPPCGELHGGWPRKVVAEGEVSKAPLRRGFSLAKTGQEGTFSPLSPRPECIRREARKPRPGARQCRGSGARRAEVRGRLPEPVWRCRLVARAFTFSGCSSCTPSARRPAGLRRAGRTPGWARAELVGREAYAHLDPTGDLKPSVTISGRVQVRWLTPWQEWQGQRSLAFGTFAHFRGSPCG
jgi:hypothetical protein